jgi:phosphatidylinositol glycan class U
MCFLGPGLSFLPATLERRPELSTPINSFMAVKEALHLQSLYQNSNHTLPQPYASGSIHLPPVLLFGLRPVWHLASEDFTLFEAYSAALWTLVDVLSGITLARIYDRKQKALKRQHGVTPEQAQLDAIVMAGSMFSSAGGVAAAYLFNPFAIASCLARSTSVLNNLAVLLATYAATVASPLLLALALTVAVLMSLYPALLIPALLLLCSRSASTTSSARNWSLATFTISASLLAVSLASGIYASYVAVGGNWLFVDRAYGTIVQLPDLSPNIGLWWYFFIEIFDHFRQFFLLVFNVHVASYALPLTIKYASDPLFAVTSLSGITAMLKSYPTLGDTALFFGMLSLHREVLPYLRYPFVTALLYVLATLLMPALHHLWLTAGSGNANFFYASTLIWALASGAAVLDLMWAWGRWRWESDRPKTGAVAQDVVRRVVQK